jgi:hypothetical protein
MRAFALGGHPADRADSMTPGTPIRSAYRRSPPARPMELERRPHRTVRDRLSLPRRATTLAVEAAVETHQRSRSHRCSLPGRRQSRPCPECRSAPSCHPSRRRLHLSYQEPSRRRARPQARSRAVRPPPHSRRLDPPCHLIPCPRRSRRHHLSRRRRRHPLWRARCCQVRRPGRRHSHLRSRQPRRRRRRHCRSVGFRVHHRPHPRRCCRLRPSPWHLPVRGWCESQCGSLPRLQRCCSHPHRQHRSGGRRPIRRLRRSHHSLTAVRSDRR